MKRVNLIYRHPLYQKKYNALQKAEEHRKFCNHTLEHFLDVARLMYIYSVEQELSISKEVIYAAAFMHDIGRIDQIEKGIPHEMAGAALWDRILPDCGFCKRRNQPDKGLYSTSPDKRHRRGHAFIRNVILGG